MVSGSITEMVSGPITEMVSGPITEMVSGPCNAPALRCVSYVTSIGLMNLPYNFLILEF
jgi:hypothetical protein